MKKIMALLIAIFMFTACVQEEPKITVFETEDGKFGLSYGEEVILEPVYDLIEAAEGDESLFYSYKAYVSGETELFLEEGGKHLYKVSERPVECFYLLDENGNRIFDIAFEKIGIDFVIDDNNNLLPNYLNGVSKGAYYSYDFSTGEPELVEEAKPEEIESDFGYTVTRYFYDTYGFVKYGVKLGEKVITENVADRIKIPLEDRILLYYGPTWQAFECGKCIIIDSEGNVLSEKFNRVEFATFENGTYVGIGITAGSRAEEPTFDENGERMPGGVWIIDKDGNILSENLFETNDFMNALGKCPAEKEVV